MGKRKKESDSESEEKDKKQQKKEDKDKKKKKDDKKTKKGDKKKKKEKKKKDKKKDESSSEDSSDESEQLETNKCESKVEATARAKVEAKVATPLGDVNTIAIFLAANLPPVEDGILRFEYSEAEEGPLGLKFSGGFPPLILSVTPGSHSAKKGVPDNHYVDAVNGLKMVASNQQHVMSGLKSRPMVMDCRPVNWIPKERREEMERQRAEIEAEASTRRKYEAIRRDSLAKEKSKQDEIDAAERAKSLEIQKKKAEEARKRHKQAQQNRKEVQEEWESHLAQDPRYWRDKADELMQAPYGQGVEVEGRRGLPLRLLTRRKEVAWLWAGETAEIIGGGVQDPGDSWSD